MATDKGKEKGVAPKGTSMTDEAALEATARMAESEGEGGFLRLPRTGRVPLYLLNGGYYKAGFEHWVDLPGSAKPHRVVCAGQDHRWDTDGCKICKLAMDSYSEAKAMRDSVKNNDEKLQAESLKKFADRAAPKFSCHMVVAMGVTLTDKKIDAKTKKEKYVYTADFSKEGDMPMEVGKINLSESQFKELKGLYVGKDVVNEKYPFMKTVDDFVNRVIWRVVGKNPKGTDKVFFQPDARVSDCPASPDSYKDITVDEDFEVKLDEIDKAYAALTQDVEGEGGYADDGDVSFATGEQAAGAPDFSDLEEGGVAEDGETVEEGEVPEEEVPEEEAAPEPAPRKAAPAPASRTRTAPRPAQKAQPGKPVSAAQRAAGKSSGKSRL